MCQLNIWKPELRTTFKFFLGIGAIAIALLVVASIPGMPGVSSAKLALRRGVMLMIAPFQSVKVVPIRDGVFWVTGGICNTGFVIGDTGVVAIDAQIFTQTTKKELEAISKLSPNSVNTVILTHSDPDHINGLPGFPTGIQIIAHENANADILRVIEDSNSNGLPPPAEIKEFAPTRIVGDRTDLTLDGVSFVLIHTAPAHTDGDLIIYLPNQKVVFAGDLLAPDVGPFPGIHLNKHGSSLGWIKFVTAMLALDVDTFVSGHGGILTRDEVISRLAVAQARRDLIKSMFDDGKSLAEIKTTLNDPPLPGIAAMFPTFTETTFEEIAAGKERGLK